jgi:hypothetical protein
MTSEDGSREIKQDNQFYRVSRGRHAAKGGGGSIQSLCVDGLPVGEGPKADEYREWPEEIYDEGGYQLPSKR